MDVTFFECYKYTTELEPSDTDRYSKGNYIGVVMEPFYGIRFFIDARYFPGETVPITRVRPRNNVAYSPMAKYRYMRNHTRYKFLTMIGTSNIDVGDSFFMCYGFNYVFKQYGMFFV